MSGVKSTDKLVLLSLADRANENHEAWPSIDRLSADCCMKRSTVISAVERLEAAGVISRRKRFAGSAVYTLIGVPDRHGKTVTSAETVTNAETGTTISAETGTALVPKTAPEPKTEPNSEPNKGSAVPHQEVIDAYHDLLPELPKVREWTPARQQLLRSRWQSAEKRKSVDYWRRFFGYVSESDFLCGRVESRDGRKPFRASLPWLLKAENFAKVIEAQYHEGGA